MVIHMKRHLLKREIRFKMRMKREISIKKKKCWQKKKEIKEIEKFAVGENIKQMAREFK